MGADGAGEIAEDGRWGGRVNGEEGMVKREEGWESAVPLFSWTHYISALMDLLDEGL